MKNSYVILLLFLVACSGPEKKILPVVAINAQLESRSLPLSEIADVDQIVRLETRPDVLIPESFVPITTDKYIITQDSKQILQFSSDGKFLRVLAVAGQGPQEFNSVSAITVNPRKEILYFTHSGDPEYIQVIDLNSGTWLDKIKYPAEVLTLSDRPRVYGLVFMNDSTFLGIPLMSPIGNSMAIFYMSASGKLLGNFATREKFNSYTYFPYPYSAVVSDKIHFVGAGIDTVYEISNDQKTPLFYLDIKDELKDPAIEGYKKTMNVEGPSFAILNTRHYTYMKRASDGTLLMTDPVNNISKPFYYLIDYEDYRSYLISDFNLDELGFTIDFFPSKNFNGNLVLPIKADLFKEKAKKVLLQNTASSEVLQRVKELDAQITENDNPILIIGKLK